MNNVWLAADPKLALVQLVSEVEGGGQQGLGIGGAAHPLPRWHVLDAALQPLRQGHAVVGWSANGLAHQSWSSRHSSGYGRCIQIRGRPEHFSLRVPPIVGRWGQAGGHDQPRARN